MDEPAAQPISLTVTGSTGPFTFSGAQWGPADGRTVLLLHGFPQTYASWGQVAVRLAEAGLHAVALDQRGYSPGARPTEVEAYALPELVSDVTAMIGALGGAVDLVGHDWGGVVGWQVAARYPQLVRTWTAVSTPNSLALNEVLATSAEQRARFGYIQTFRETGKAEAALLADDAAGLRSVYGNAVAPQRVAHDVAVLQQPGVLTLALNWYRAMAPTDSDGLPRVAVPTSYIWGSEDIAFGRAAAERTGAFVDAPYTYLPLEGASHWLPDEAADTLADVICRQVLGK